MHDINGWTEFLDSQFFNLFDRSLILRELIIQIRRVASPPAKVIEVGCGSGLTSILLASMGYRVTAIDANSDLIQQLKRYEIVFPNIYFRRMNMFRTDFMDKHFDVVFSQGVLEHYSDEDIVRALDEQKRIAQVIVIDVPNARGKIGDYGDERAITSGQWRQFIQSIGFKIVVESARGMARWSERQPKLLGWLEDSWLSRRFGENSIFVCKEV
jgi:SAM-dependent methyltransferase